jgi:hypothetical protein
MNSEGLTSSSSSFIIHPPVLGKFYQFLDEAQQHLNCRAVNRKVGYNWRFPKLWLECSF